ncbi:MAG: response regulator [Sphingomonas sanxanigenens]|uniref:Response regulator n=1 Tax=Sphingomonas sanxanigenens TaxID=397260 RepID=A0A2W5AD32_9SPHN|nr:MAG: response regulator [Sphingomonas sanxanigenens]
MLFTRGKRLVDQILIVEDEPLVAFDNEHFLVEHGYRVVATVNSAAQALAVIASEEIDLVLADVNLSDRGDGIEVARAAQEREIATLFVTATCPANARELSIGCLSKPYSQRDLKAAIEAVDAKLSGRKTGKLPEGLTLY